EDKTYRVRAATDIAALASGALVLLTTKVSDSEAAIRPIVNLVHADTTILCVQNGLYSEDVVKAIVGERCVVLRAITHVGAIFRTPGGVELKVSGSTRIEAGPRSDAIADALTRCGLDAQVTSRMKDEMWHKLVVNCVITPINAMTRAEVGAIAD